MYAFAGQIYCDFGLHRHRARAGKLFGLELTRNFLTPTAHSPSISARWHISLSRWLGTISTSAGRQPTRLAQDPAQPRHHHVPWGLWHGAGFGFIVWGLYHGLLLVLYRLWPVDEQLQRRFGKVGTALAIVLMFNLASFGWIFFRATPAELWPLLSSLATQPSIASTGSCYGGWRCSACRWRSPTSSPSGTRSSSWTCSTGWPAGAGRALRDAVLCLRVLCRPVADEFIYFSFKAVLRRLPSSRHRGAYAAMAPAEPVERSAT